MRKAGQVTTLVRDVAADSLALDRPGCLLLPLILERYTTAFHAANPAVVSSISLTIFSSLPRPGQCFPQVIGNALVMHSAVLHRLALR